MKAVGGWTWLAWAAWAQLSWLLWAGGSLKLTGLELTCAGLSSWLDWLEGAASSHWAVSTHHSCHSCPRGWTVTSIASLVSTELQNCRNCTAGQNINWNWNQWVSNWQGIIYIICMMMTMKTTKTEFDPFLINAKTPLSWWIPSHLPPPWPNSAVGALERTGSAGGVESERDTHMHILVEGIISHKQMPMPRGPPICDMRPVISHISVQEGCNSVQTSGKTATYQGERAWAVTFDQSEITFWWKSLLDQFIHLTTRSAILNMCDITKSQNN